MKGIAVWIWLIAGLIVGIIMFMLFFQLMSFLTLSRAREDAKQSFDDLTSSANALCQSKSGTQETKNIVFPSTVSIVYSTSDPKIYQEKNNRTYGSFACLKFQNEQYCEGLPCNLEFEPIRSTQTVLGLVDTLMGKSDYQQHLVTLSKNECGVSILGNGEPLSSSCGNQCKTLPLIKCQNSVILGLANPRILVMTDMSGLVNCCTGNDKIINLLDNAATYFGGHSILIVWELDKTDPTSQTRMPIINSLNGLGFTVTQTRHMSPLAYDDIKNFDQIWLFRPGWCKPTPDSPQLQPCDGAITWSISEINAISTYAGNGGKIFLFTDTTAGENKNAQSVVNNILSATNTTASVDNTIVCGYGQQTISTSDIANNPITKGIGSIDINAAARIQC